MRSHVRIIALAIALISADVSAQDQNKPDATVKDGQAQHEKNPPSPGSISPNAQQTEMISAAASDQSGSAIYKSTCGESTDHNQADLCEQKRQGGAAVDAAYWTWAQFVAGIAGLGAVLVTLGFNVIATFSAKSAAEAAREQVKMSRENAEKTQRAFVYFKSHNLASIPNSNFYEIETVFYNSGATPAKNCFTRVNWQRFPIASFPNGTGSDFDFPELAASDGRKESVRFFIGPQQERSGGNCEIPAEYIGSILRRTHRILIWGWVEYDDVFVDTARHRTEFCYSIDLDRTAGAGVGPERLRFVTYHRHNGSDEECLKPVQTSRSGASRIIYGSASAKVQPTDSGAS